MKAAGFVVIVALGTVAAHAMSVTPTTFDITLKGAKSNGTIRIVNNGATPLSVELGARRLLIQENGQGETKPAADKFLLFPPQVLVAPGATQAVRVQWLGAADLKKSETYLITVKQLGVPIGPSQSGIQWGYSVSVLVNIVPPGSKPSVSIVEADVVKGKPQVTFENKGSRHMFVSEGQLVLSGGNWSEALSGSALRGALRGLGLVPPGAKRRFVLETKIPSQISRLSAQFTE